MQQKIVFDLIRIFPYPVLPPVPSRKLIPTWFKKMKTLTSGKEKDERGERMRTVKKCVPFLDAMSIGYTLLTHIDMLLTIDKGEVRNIFLDEEHKKHLLDHNPIENHPSPQVEGSPFENYKILKYLSPWRIKAPEGYSLLFVPPMNQFELSYIPLCGLVDSDTYDGVVNFPFIVPALSEGTQVMIPAGSPFVQVIPVKRDEWKEEISNTVGNKSIIQHYDQLDADRYDFYRKNSWKKKSYR